MTDHDQPRPILAERLRAIARDGDTVTLSREEATLLIDVADRAYELLINAYSSPGDEQGVRMKSEDAVRLQWALRQIGIGDDTGQPCFTV